MPDTPRPRRPRTPKSNPEFRSLEADVLLARARFARQVGLAFGNKRDYYDVLGYDRDLTARQLRETYLRGGIAKRIVDAYPKATWRGGVQVYEDENPETQTEFERVFAEVAGRIKLWSVLQRADILAGQSTYAVILIGVAQGSLDEPLPRGTPKQLLYLQPYWSGGGPSASSTSTSTTVSAEVDATILEYDMDPRSARFGEPLYYSLKRTNVQLPFEARKVHWTRIIHVAEGCLDDNVFGIPTLENVWNLLQDLMKVTGGGAEAYWLRANQGLHVNIDKDLSMDATKDTIDKLKDDLEKYAHGLTRWIRSRGTDVNVLGSDVANFGPSADAILKQIAGSKGIPVRILMGSEMGQLASGQDAENWNAQVQDRRTTHAEPVLLRQTVDRLIEYGYLPTPKRPYQVAWPVEEEMTEPQKADLAVKMAQASTTFGMPLFTEAEIREKCFDMKPLTDKQIQDIEDRQAPEPEPAPMPLPNEAETAPAIQARAANDREMVRVLADAIASGNVAVVDRITGLSHRYGTTQVQLPSDVAERLFAIGRRIADAEIYEPEGGRETDAHVTVRYGLIDPDPKDVLEVVARRGPITFTLGRTAIFTTPAYDVVYVAVNGPDLAALHAVIGFGVECVPSDHGAYVPHATVAYVQPGTGHQYVGIDDLEGVEVTVDSIVVSDANGNRTEVSLV